jgi:Sugar (and other) transporter
VSNQYIYILIFALILSIAAVVLLVVVLEESPLYLMKKGEFDRANAVMNRIHRMNVGAKRAETEAYQPLLISGDQLGPNSLQNVVEG